MSSSAQSFRSMESSHHFVADNQLRRHVAQPLSPAAENPTSQIRSNIHLPPLAQSKLRSKIAGKPIAPLHSAALQDHFARSLNLSFSNIRSTQTYNLNFQLPSLSTVSTHRHIKKKGTDAILDPRRRQRARWAREKELSEHKPNNKKEQIADDEDERTLDPPPPPSSLAQRLGLISKPPPRLSTKQWEQVKQRSLNRDDAVHSCPICQEPYTLEDQVYTNSSPSIICMNNKSPTTFR